MAMYRPFKFVPPLKAEETNEKYAPYVALNSIFTDREIDLVLGLWREDAAHQGKVASNTESSGAVRLNLSKRSAKEMFVEAEGNEWIYDKIGMACLMLNSNVFKLDILGFKGRIRMLKYQEGDFFDWHTDHGAGMKSDRKLVVCMQLSDGEDYEGGDLQLVTDKLNVPRKKGSTVIFPAYVLHRVTPVISGIRKSLVALIGGPPFR